MMNKHIVIAVGLIFSFLTGCTVPPTKTVPLTKVPITRIVPPTKADSLRAIAERKGVVRVIVTLAESPGVAHESAAGVSLVTTMQANLVSNLRSMGVLYAQSIPAQPFVVTEVTSAQLARLLTDSRVVAVHEDTLARTQLAQSVPLVRAPEVWARGARGAGRAIAILDTGVDSAHPFLTPRVVEEACFSSTSPSQGASSFCPNGASQITGAGSGRQCNAAGCDHGTHVAGIAAGRGTIFSGVAPDADIIAIQVFSQFTDRPGGPQNCANNRLASPCALSFTSDQIRALGHVNALRSRLRVASVNMSLGGGRETANCDANPIKLPIDQLRAAQVATVIASGNNGYTDAVGSPGCVSSAVTIGSTTKQDQVSGFSNSYGAVDLLAPGSIINSSVPGSGFAVKSGTSMATPHVAGAFALVSSGVSTASFLDIENALKATGHPVLDARNGLSIPRISLLPALLRLRMFEPVAATSGIAGFDLKRPNDRVLTFDFNGDGKKDVVLYRPGTGAISIGRSNGDGSFIPAYSQPEPGSGIAGFDLRRGNDEIIDLDFDGDGKDDLLLYRPGTGAITVAHSNGDGTFTSLYSQPEPGQGIAGFDLLRPIDRIVALDFDGDGKDDIVLYRPGKGAISIARSIGNGNFTPVYLQGEPGNGFAGFDLKSVTDRILPIDFDGDGRKDILLYRPGAGAIAIAKSNGNGTFSNVYSQPEPGSGIAGFDLRSGTDRILACDFDGDGKQDLVLYRPGTGAISIARSNGNGNFAPVYSQVDPGNGFAGFDLHKVEDRIIAADFNGDGKEDLLLYRSGAGAVSVAYSNGNGTFATVHTQPDPGTGIGGADLRATSDVVVPMDFNGDKMTDVLVVRPGGGSAWIVKSNGDK